MRLNLKRQFFLPCLLLVGCVQSNAVVNANQPGWINGGSAKYSNSQYMTANASASGAQLAKDRALANLAKNFELRIRQIEDTEQTVHIENQDGNQSFDKTTNHKERIKIETDKIIEGARIAEQWKSPDLTYYALAVLDRHQAGNNIRAEIKRFDKEADFELNSIEAKSNPLQKVAVYQRVLASQSKRDALQKTLKIIDLSGQGVAAKWNRAELREKLEASLSALTMKSNVLRDDIGGVAKLLKGAMAKSGFAESSGSSKGYTLSVGLETLPAFFKQDWHWLRGTLTLQLISADGSVQGNKTWPLKTSASSQQQLKSRMLEKVEKKLNQMLKETVLGFATLE